MISVSALVFGAFALLYSFSGLLEIGGNNNNNFPFQPFQYQTLQEIGGHFLFGYIVALPSRNLKIGIITGLMALTMDFDHLLNAVGFELQSRLAHSIPFVIISSILMGLIMSRFYNKAQSITERVQNGKLRDSIFTEKIFLQFLIITLAAFLSHIAYDVFVDDQASFPLLAPFSFDNFVIPAIYALPLEAAGALMIYFYYMRYYKGFPKARSDIVVKDKK
jgi:hypothetical protein